MGGIVDAIVGDLRHILKETNLNVLLKRLEGGNFHIHDKEFGTIPELAGKTMFFFKYFTIFFLLKA